MCMLLVGSKLLLVLRDHEGWNVFDREESLEEPEDGQGWQASHVDEDREQVPCQVLHLEVPARGQCDAYKQEDAQALEGEVAFGSSQF